MFDTVPKLRTITGRVVNENGEPLAGANVMIKGTGKGTVTDAKGEFVLKNVEDGDVLVISNVGYETKGVNVKGNASAVNVVLKNAEKELEEVVLNGGYYTTTKRLSTGNISKVTAEEIEKQPVSNPLLALQGRVPGIDVTQTSGYAGAPFKVEIRGRK